MFSSVMKLLAIVVLLCVLIESSSATHTWGNMNGDGSAFVRSKSRVSKPSSGRKMKITFPDVSLNQLKFMIRGCPKSNPNFVSSILKRISLSKVNQMR